MFGKSRVIHNFEYELVKVRHPKEKRSERENVQITIVKRKRNRIEDRK